MPKLWFYAGSTGTPDTSVAFEDSDEEWTEALSSPEVLEPAQKNKCVAVCGAEFAEGAVSKEQTADNLYWSHALVLDIDVWREDRPPYTLEEIQELFDGIRFIAWNSFSSTDVERRWRVVVPLATPMPPSRYRALWTYLNGCLDGTMSDSTADPGRLGYLGAVGSQIGLDQYRWCIGHGEYLDWQPLDLDEDELTGHKKAIDPLNLTRSPEWISDAQALKNAKNYFKRAGDDVEVGSRHAHLLKVACRLWWEWALSEDAVREVLHEVNDNFVDPKPPDDVEAEVQAAWERCFGEKRVEQPALFGQQRDPIDRCTTAAIMEHGKRLRRSQEDSRRLVGRALLAIAEGAPIGEPSEARTLISRAAEEIARAYPRDSPERLCDLLRPSLRAQKASGASVAVPTDTEVLSWIQHVQRTQRSRQEQREKARADDLAQRILSATDHTRSTTYSAQEYKQFYANGLTDRSWVLWQNRSFFLYSNGEYVGPFSDRAAQLEAYLHFAAAQDKIELETLAADGKLRRYSIDELAMKYGSSVKHVFVHLDKDKSKYNPQDSILEIAKCPVREMDAEFSAEVDEWLKALAQDKYEMLCEWLAAVTYLDKPLIALFLCTKKGQGKNLLVEGITRLWTKGGYASLHGFQASRLESCPLVFCDEKLPQDWRKDPIGKLMHFVSASKHHVKKPYVGEYDVIGYSRLVFSSNDPALFASEELSKKAANEAFYDRVLMINTLNAQEDLAGDYLRSLSASGFVLDDFITKDIVAKHLLWLRDNKKIDFRKRFFVQDSNKEFEKASSVTNALPDRVLNWILAFLETGKFQNDAVLAKAGALYVNATDMYEIWEMYDNDKKSVPAGKLTRTVSYLAEKSVKISRQSSASNKVKRRYKKINPSFLDYWIKANDQDKKQYDELVLELEQRKPFNIV